MDPYERLAAINEEISRLKDNVQLDESDGPVVDPFTNKKVKPKRAKQQMGGPVTKGGKPYSPGQSKYRQEIFKAIDKAANTQEDPDKVAARLSAFYDKQDRSIFGESTEKIDQEFGAAKKALKDAGIEHDALQAIGSLDREKNTFKISKENMRKAREVLKKFPNAQIRRK